MLRKGRVFTYYWHEKFKRTSGGIVVFLLNTTNNLNRLHIFGICWYCHCSPWAAVLPVKALLPDPLVSSGSHHVRLESNLLWWKDKETLIEILPPGRFVLSSHMGLTSYFPGARQCTVCLTPQLQQRTTQRRVRDIWFHVVNCEV